MWPVEEEDDRQSAQQSRTINITDEVLLPQHIPPYYFPRSSTSPSFSSEADNEVSGQFIIVILCILSFVGTSLV